MEQQFQQALHSFQQGQLAESRQILNGLMDSHPDFPFAYNLAGVVAFQEGQFVEAERLFKQALELHQEAFDFYLNLGHLYLTQERIKEAVPLLEKSLNLHPEQLPIRQQVIEYYVAQQNIEKALQHLKEFLKLSPQSPEALTLFVQLAIQMGLLKEAQKALQQLPMRPTTIQLWEHFSVKALESSHHDLARQGFENLLLVQPNHPQMLNNLGTVYSHLNQSSQAMKCFEQALDNKSDYAEAYLNRAFHRWSSQGEVEAIIEDLQAALKYKPELEEAIFVWAQQLPELNLLYIVLLEALMERGAFRVQAASCLALAYEKRGDINKTRYYYEKILEIEPFNYWYEIKLATTISPFLNDWSEIKDCRQKIKIQLKELLKKYDPVRLNFKELSATLFKISSYTFNLAYHGLNDLEINGLCGQLWHQIFSQTFPPQPHKDRTPGPIRVAFVSTFFRTHSVMFCFWPLIEELAQESEFEVSCIALTEPEKEDELTAKIRATVKEFKYIPLSISAYQELFDFQFDIIIYPDVGMNPFSYIVAQWRLAPVQVALAGHPVTTGSLNMDYFISSELYEIPEAQQHYSEHLVLLKNTDVAYQLPALPPTYKTREQLGWTEEQHIYFCPMTLFKIHPDFDLILRDILLADPEGLCLFAHDTHKFFSPQLIQRFQKRIPEVIEQIQFLDWLPFETYLNMLYRADVVLDSVHFGGGNTNYQTMAVGTPLITWPSRYFRGRSAQAIYSLLGISDCVVDSHEAYVKKAVQIASDKDYQQNIRNRILQGHHCLFDNHAGNREMINFFKEVAFQG